MTRLSLLFIILQTALVILTKAWIIPPKLSNGVYEITFQKTADYPPQVHVVQYAIDPYTRHKAARDGNRFYAPWPRAKPGCYLNGTGITDVEEVRLARKMLANWCEGFAVQKLSIVVAIYGSTTWYLCNWRGQYGFPHKKQYCSRNEVVAASRAIAKACKNDLSWGFVDVRKWDMRYGTAGVGSNVCEDRGWGLGELWLNSTRDEED